MRGRGDLAPWRHAGDGRARVLERESWRRHCRRESRRPRSWPLLWSGDVLFYNTIFYNIFCNTISVPLSGKLLLRNKTVVAQQEGERNTVVVEQEGDRNPVVAKQGVESGVLAVQLLWARDALLQSSLSVGLAVGFAVCPLSIPRSRPSSCITPSSRAQDEAGVWGVVVGVVCEGG